MPTEIVFQRNVPVRAEVDVFVAGGGPAGVAAALTAARQGRKVYLAEAHTCLGGAGTAAMIPAFMPFGDSQNFLADGVGREVLESLRKMDGIYPLTPSNCPGIKAELLKRLYDDLLTSAGVEISFHAQAIDVAKEGDRVSAVVCSGKSGLFAIKPKIVIDCTGDGDVAARAGAPFEKGDADGKLMPGTLCSLWADVDWETIRAAKLHAEAELPKAFADKVFTVEDRHLPGMWQVGETVGGGNIGHTFGVDGTDERSLTKALLWGRKVLPEYERFYKNYMKGYSRMKLVATGSLLGVRETRRITGDYVLNFQDFERRAAFEDEIGRFNYWIDVHASTPSKKDAEEHFNHFRRLTMKAGESYGIPYRALIAKTLANVLVAGRCISVDRYMQASIRVMPGCYITGQATGMAASLAVEKNTDARGVPVRELQTRLKKLGAYLPNCN